MVRVEVIDDGHGLGGEHARAAGHGLANMRTRASRVGARLDIADRNPGVRVLLELELERQHALVA
jgi:signal transduction histidine kinase